MRAPTPRLIGRTYWIWFLAVMGLLGHTASSQTRETVVATATVKTAAGATASAPLTLSIDRKQTDAEAAKLADAFRKGGAAALRKALDGVPPTGTIKVGDGPSVPTRITIERTTDKGRLLTVVADKPVLFLGSGVPGAKAKEGYDFAVLDLELQGAGGTGTFAPAARIAVKQGAFIVEDYAVELIRLASVKTSK